MLDYAIAAVCVVCGLTYLVNRAQGKGTAFWKSYFYSLIYLHFHKKKHKKQLSVYENLSVNNVSPVEVGIIPSPLEYKAENPHKDSDLSDGIHFAGVDSKQNMIDLCINRIEKNMALVWVVLKCTDGEMYALPFDGDSRKPYIENESLFSCAGLQIRCLSPLRKWRISFNGLLRKCKQTENGNSSTGEMIHVKFSFIWQAMSCVYDLSTDYCSKELSKASVNAGQCINYKLMQSFQKIQNRYEQWGQLMGTISLGNSEETEYYLWSIKTRISDFPPWDSDICSTKLFMYFTNGFPLKIEALSIENVVSNFVNGYTKTSGGKFLAVSECDFDISQLKKLNSSKMMQMSFIVGGNEKSLMVESLRGEESFHVGPSLQWLLTMKPFKAYFTDDDFAYGILHNISRSDTSPSKRFHLPPVILKDPGYTESKKFLLSLEDDLCKSSHITGGKGSSLALLTHLSKLQCEFSVPKGVVVTTVAFTNHIENNPDVADAIQKLNSISCQKVSGNLKEECSTCMKEFCSSKLSYRLKQEIHNALTALFDDFDSVRFSVRSSSFGEDSEELSAAGQMLTVLGIRGINNIFDAILKCWSSKFGFEAVQYSRQNGQLITMPMAVVIQEMVPADTAGVLFTVDPATGNPMYPYITANYGLGETVVSSLAEPDTIILERNNNDDINVSSIQIGSKHTQVHMTDVGVEEKHIGESDACCLTTEWAIKIGNVGLLVEKCFCSPRDIEWAISNEQLYLLQARPITTLHIETDFELIHDQDNPVTSDYEFWTRANTGEVFLGATSPLGISLIVSSMDVYGHQKQIIREKNKNDAFCPYYFHLLPVTHRQVTLSLLDTLFRINEKELSASQKSFEVALFGRTLASEAMHKAGIRKYGYVSRMRKLKWMVMMYMYLFIIPRQVKQVGEMLKNYSVSLDSCTTTSKTWDSLLNQMHFYSVVCNIHGMATFVSSFYNLVILSIMGRRKKEWDNELYCDFATLLSSCIGVESADVPESLQNLAKAIAENGDLTFASVPTNVALSLLNNDTSKAGSLFKDFLNKHGHRCVKEFDVYSLSWGMKPENLVNILQNMVKSSNVLNSTTKEETSPATAIAKIKTPLPGLSKIILKFVLPLGRTAVGDREKTKSMLIKVVDYFRRTCYHLGNLMVQEGMLPSEELIFFLTMDEIKEIIDTQRPGLVSKAIRRHRLHPKLDALKFPEIIEGIPKPLQDDDEEDTSNYTESFTLTGTPVCQGYVKAKAKVILKLEEAPTIENGDILITHATDIGWSPYFPLLSGVVTVLGGLISHGAVVAREYGLPCVVGVQKATTAFKSGDIVILNGKKGTVTKVVEGEIENC